MASKMLIHLALLVVISIADQANAMCPEKYTRFSLQHSFCRDRNPTCSIIREGVDKKDRQTILKVHNKLRNKVATGKEKRAGGLPTASNMLQMEWDMELASIAQKWVEQCTFDHDCSDCRRVENFAVGQNMAEENLPCLSNDCSNVNPNWKTMITMFYKEVSFFKKKYVSPFVFAEEFGHFSQVVWANSWKIGCGYVAFKNGNGVKSIYACNYGPGGNIRTKSMYEPGPPASACPSNTCSGCKIKGPTYPGLCKVRNLSLGPVYENKKESLLDCNWRDEKSPCQVTEKEKKGWKLKRALGGFYKTITLKGGEKSQLALISPIQPKGSAFCVVVEFRKGPASASEKDSSSMSLLVHVPAADHSSSSSLTTKTTTEFIKFYVNFGWNMLTEMAVEVQIPPNAPDHIIDIKDITVYDGRCDKYRNAGK